MNRTFGVSTMFLVTMTLNACVTPSRISPSPAPMAEAITFSVGPCFGFCPVYEATVSPDGRLRYVGQRNTAILGERTRNAGKAAYRLLASDLARFRPATGGVAAVECVAAVSDTSPYTVTWTEAEGRKTTATVQSGCPGGAGKDLVEVLRAIPLRLGISDWAKQMTHPGAHRG